MSIITDTTDILADMPDLGPVRKSSGMYRKEACSSGRFRVGKNGVRSVISTRDEKVEFIAFEDHTLAHVRSAMGYTAYYPVNRIRFKRPVKYLLMDLDGTTVRSEDFWVWIIQLTIADLIKDSNFTLNQEDIPYVSGHSVSEHLQYCIDKYSPGASLERARELYFENTRKEMEAIAHGDGRRNVFKAAPGLKDFLVKLKERGVRIALVTSGLYEKAYPELLSVFEKLNLGAPEEFYDAIITAGVHPGNGKFGTLGELEAKPHPWLYAEAAVLGLGVKDTERDRVVGIDDSSAGICAIRLAGFTPVGFGGGNIIEGGTKDLCEYYSEDFESIFRFITGEE